MPSHAEPNTVREIMTRKVVSLTPTTNVKEAVDIFQRRGFPVLPVVAANGELLGALTQRDCIRILCEALYEGWPEGLVSDHMTTDFDEISPDEDVFTLARRFIEGQLRGFPVVENGRLVGVVSRRDLLGALQRALEAGGRAPHKGTYELIEERRRS